MLFSRFKLDQEPDPDPLFHETDPNPYQNETDLKHWLKVSMDGDILKI